MFADMLEDYHSLNFIFYAFIGDMFCKFNTKQEKNVTKARFIIN